jgi:hypothetical protein
MKYLLILLLSLATLKAQTSVAYSPVYGYNKLYLEPGANIIIDPFINPPIYSGKAVVDGTTFTINNVLTNNIIDIPYYVEVTSTNYNGYIFDITTNTKNIITATNVPPEFQGQTLAINVRKHVTLQQFISNSTGLQDYSDALSTPNGNDGWVTYIYISNGIVAGDYYTPADNAILYPGEYICINNCGNISFTFVGELVYTNQIK